MNDWGLKAGIDYNEQDVEIGDLLEGMPADDKVKKRKYDFIIPYQSRSLALPPMQIGHEDTGRGD